MAVLPPEPAQEQRTSLLLQAARNFIAECMQPGDFAIDATVGNGHDTVFLAHCAGPQGRVFGFDIQAGALSAAQARLMGAGLSGRVALYHAGHERLDALLPPEARQTIRAAMFNLGYLPGGDHGITTRGANTVDALTQVLAHLVPGGRVSAVIYTGHAGGEEEGAAVTGWVAGLDRRACQALHTRLLNQGASAPQLLLIERRCPG
ncbi:MAG: rRNA methyltransferase [Candidatus Hydrogenedentes bacterium]|nr:rRNA methyltransferase [Candidatus Hydrogenedentota bacterium]